MQVQLLPDALSMARSSNGRMRDPQSRDTGSSPVRVTDMAKWRNWYTRDAQNVVPARACEFDSRLGYWNIAGAAGAQLTFIRSVARLDTETCNLNTSRVGQCSFGSHKPEQPGATPGPATLER